MKLIITLTLILSLVSCDDGAHTNKEATSTSEKTAATSSTSSENSSDDSKTKNENEVNVKQYDTLRATKSGIIDWVSHRKSCGKGKTLYSYNNSTNFQKISDRKEELRTLIDSLVKNAHEDLGLVEGKWISFRNSLRNDTLLPQFPTVKYREEGMYYGNVKTKTTFNEIAELEQKMKADFVSAKKKYNAIDWRIKKGQKVKRGEIVAICEYASKN